MITQAIEDYLKIIYKLTSGDTPVTTNAIAERLSISQASVTGMIKKLADLKLIKHTPYHGVALTEGGKKIALEIIRHHRLLELYLAETLGYSWDQVHAEAEKLEHVISEDFEDKVAELLGHPTIDPHGAPIPTKDGKVLERKLIALTTAKIGQTVVVQQVSDSDSEMLRYLGEIGIFPNVVLEIVDRAPFEGPILIRVKKNEHHLSRVLTDNILVAPTDHDDMRSAAA
ncbi:metal-dependent transcriptional regulator [bacterium]|nr:metal-dependent transcriptional regulator [bacterium]